MINNTANKLIDSIKQQAQVFLLDAGEFFPFGTVIDKHNDIIPIGANLHDPNDRPQLAPLINLLEKHIKDKISTGDYIIGAIALDVTLNKNNFPFDGIAIRIFEADQFYELLFKYVIKYDRVVFELTQ